MSPPVASEALTVLERSDGPDKSIKLAVVLNQASAMVMVYIHQKGAALLELPSYEVIDKAARSEISDHARKYNPKFL